MSNWQANAEADWAPPGLCFIEDVLYSDGLPAANVFLSGAQYQAVMESKPPFAGEAARRSFITQFIKIGKAFIMGNESNFQLYLRVGMEDREGEKN